MEPSPDPAEVHVKWLGPLHMRSPMEGSCLVLGVDVIYFGLYCPFTVKVSYVTKIMTHTKKQENGAIIKSKNNQ